MPAMLETRRSIGAGAPRLETFDGDDLRQLGESLRQVARAAGSMEDAATRVVGPLYDELQDDAGGPLLCWSASTRRIRSVSCHPT